MNSDPSDSSANGKSLTNVADILPNTYVLIAEDTPSAVSNPSFSGGYEEIESYFEYHKKRGKIISYDLPHKDIFKSPPVTGNSYPVSYVLKKGNKKVEAAIFKTSPNIDTRISVFRSLS